MFYSSVVANRRQPNQNKIGRGGANVTRFVPSATRIRECYLGDGYYSRVPGHSVKKGYLVHLYCMNVFYGPIHNVLRGTRVNGTYGIHKNLHISLCLLTIYLVLFTMVPRNSMLATRPWFTAVARCPASGKLMNYRCNIIALSVIPGENRCS